MVLDAGPERTSGEVFNVGHSDENYRKLDLVEVITGEPDRGRVFFVKRDEEFRDHKLRLARRAPRSASSRMRGARRVHEVGGALEVGEFEDPWSRTTRNTP
jgi:hypothetical protein